MADHPMSRRRAVLLVLLVLALLWLWGASGEWHARGCSPGKSLRLALQLGAPEWGQYCRRGQ